MRFGFRHGRGREHQHDRDGVGARPPTVPTPPASASHRESSPDRRRGPPADHPPVVGARRHPLTAAASYGRPSTGRTRRSRASGTAITHVRYSIVLVYLSKSRRASSARPVVGILTARLPLAIPMTRPREARRWPAKRASARGVRFQNASTRAENSLSHRFAIPTRSPKDSCFAGFLRDGEGGIRTRDGV